MASENYLGNPRLKRADTKVEYTPEQVAEYIKCSEDPIYFILTYCKIVNIDKGLIMFPLWEFQKEMILAFEENRFVICKMPRQVGKTTTTAGFILWRVLFNEHYSVAILANKDKKAREILDRIQKMFENLPQWMQQVAAIFPLKWMTQGARSVFLPDSFAAQEVAGSWETGRTFAIIGAWLVVGLIWAIRSFKWERH